MTTPAEALARRAELVRKFRAQADEFDELARDLRDELDADPADVAYAGELEAVAGDYRSAADLLEYGSPLLLGGCPS